MRYFAVALLTVLFVSMALNAYFVTLIVHPRPLAVWNVPAVVKPHSYLFSTMFDTFKMHIHIDANSTVYVYVFTPSEYVAFYDSGGSVRSSVEAFSGEAISFTFNLSTGCAGYVWVVYNPSNSAVLVQPDVTAVYSPSSQATGACSN